MTDFTSRLSIRMLSPCWAHHWQETKGDSCFHHKNNKTGICTNLLKCPEALEVVKQNLHPQRCGFDGLHVIVCCSKFKEENVPGKISKEKCKEYSQYVWTKELNPTLLINGDDIIRRECPFNREQLIVGGTKATRREFPHMVHLGYDFGENETKWACGGSLISDQFVLTAAHCLESKSLNVTKFARMGITEQDNDDHIQIFDIVKRIPYPEYSPLYRDHDIALVKLNRTAQLNTWVRPACLYSSSSLPDSNVIASGWGNEYSGGDPSISLLKVVLRLYGFKHCNYTYKKNKGLPNGFNDNTMICAGSSMEDKDTCQGDSGGPLQIYKGEEKNMSCMYDIVGITSFGAGCAIGRNIPAVYTRVSFYIKWIEDTIWPATEDVEY